MVSYSTATITILFQFICLSVAIDCDEPNSNLFCTNQLPAAQYSCDCGLEEEFTLDDIVTLRKQLQDKMNTVPNPSCDTFDNDPNEDSFSHPLLATLVRLAFHDCAGGITYPLPDEDDDDDDDVYEFNKVAAICDGCLNLNNSKHNGLQYAVEALEDIYQDLSSKWSSKISYADFYMIAATMAVEYGHELATESTSDNSTLNEIGYFCGRPSCLSAPTTSKVFDFPVGTECLQHHVGYMHDRFKFDASDFVALIGAHKLGRMHSDFSGFSGPWARGVDELDNGYYKALKGDTVNDLNKFKQTEAIGCDDTPTGRVQWETPASPFFNLVMLNVDMVQERKLCPYIVDDITGSVHANNTNDNICEQDDNRSCPFSDDSSQEFMQEYTNSNQEWLNAFVDVFRTMIHSPYKKGKLCRIGESELSASYELSSSELSSSELSSSELSSSELSSSELSASYEGFGAMFNEERYKFNKDNENDNKDVKYTVTLSHKTSMNLLCMILFGIAFMVLTHCLAYNCLFKKKAAVPFENSVDEMNQNV